MSEQQRLTALIMDTVALAATEVYAQLREFAQRPDVRAAIDDMRQIMEPVEQSERDRARARSRADVERKRRELRRGG